MFNPSLPPEVASFPRRYAVTRRFTLGAPRSFTVSSDGSRVVFLQSAGPEDAQTSLWSIKRGDSTATVLHDAGARTDTELTDAERARRERLREQASGVVSYAAVADCSEVVFALGGTLHRASSIDGSVRTLASTADAFDPRPSPVDSRVAYVSGRTLRIADGPIDAVVPGTDDLASAVSWGSAEFVAAEEMGRGRGFWWAPDGSRLAACRVDVSEVPSWWIGSPDRPWVPPHEIRYPAAGSSNADVQLWIIDPQTGPHVEVDWRRGEFEYLADVRWGERLLCTVQTRDQRIRVVLEVDSATGATHEIQRDVDPHWVELFGNTPLLTDRGLVMISDDDRVRRLTIGGAAVETLELNVRQLVGVHDGTVVVSVTTDGTDAVLASVDRDDNVTLLTEPGEYVTAVQRGGTAVVSTSKADGDTTCEIWWSDGTRVDLPSMAGTPGFPCTPSFHFLGPRRLATALCLPHGHDGSPLPVLLDPYGGPHAQRVLRARNAYATSQWFAEQGFAVVIIDGRGTPGRGPAFEREVWGDLAVPVLEDQIDGLHALAVVHSELDLTRVGIRGWSFGGYLAALAVLRRPDVFHAAVAGAPVTDWRLYDTHYTERYLGHPDEHPEHYERSGLIGDAARLERPLMLIHGLADDNVVAAHTLTFSQALLEAGRAHEVLPLSGVTHMTPQEQVAENLLHLQRDFLLRQLGSGLTA